MATTSQSELAGKRPIAVFDYDGTCIDGQSGKLLYLWMLRRGLLTVRSTIGLALWAGRYKFHLPYKQNYARESVFRSLSQRDPAEVDALLSLFHEEVLVPRYRPRALMEVARRASEGCATVLVSATFQTIAVDAMRYMGINDCIATQMAKDEQGRYTGKVLGDVIVGEAKVAAVRAWANKSFGEDNWRLACAYGDHHSDIELLSAAECPIAVSPGPTLKKVARRSGWRIESWKTR